MSNTSTTIIALAVSVILILIVPLGTMLNRNDNVTQESVKLIVEEFVTKVQNTGKISRAQYQTFQNELAATGNSYETEIELHHLDENPGKKTSQANYTKIGENVYYIEYTTQVLKQLGIKIDDQTVSDDNDSIILKEGDMIYVNVKNNNSTAAQTLQSSFLGYSNAGEYVISASASGMITINGSK